MDRQTLLTRRGLLQAGLFGSAVVWAGGIVGLAARRAPAAVAAASRVALPASGADIVRAVMPVVLGSLLPATEPERTRALDAGVATLDAYVASLSLPLQAEAANVFRTLDLWPARVIFVGTASNWRDMSPETIAAFLRSARDSRFDLLRRVYVFLQSMAVLAWFDQPAAWPAIGYPGPPIQRPDNFGGQV